MLTKLELFQFRNFTHENFSFQQGINVITGANGSGKSSILEAIFYLARGRSFRANHAEALINMDAKDFTIRALLAPELSLATRREKSGKTQHKLAGETCGSLLELSEHLPVLLLDTNSQRWLAASPKNRRQVLDWGLFYGRRAEFYQCWRAFKRCLMQRNAAIKACSNFHYWDGLFLEHASVLDQLRVCYVEDLQQTFANIWQACGLSELGSISLKYLPGYQTDLKAALASSSERDQKLGHTSVGPHRADLAINVNGRAAHTFLSQGQQKLLTYVLTIAQAQLHKADTEISCILLLDDVFAELDLAKREMIHMLLSDCSHQIILTGIVAAELEPILKLANFISLDDRQPGK